MANTPKVFVPAYEYFLNVMYSDGSSSECELMPRANRGGFKINEGAKVQIWLLPRTIVVGVGVFDVNSAMNTKCMQPTLA